MTNTTKLLIALLCCSLTVPAQNHPTDRLQTTLHQTESDNESYPMITTVLLDDNINLQKGMYAKRRRLCGND